MGKPPHPPHPSAHHDHVWLSLVTAPADPLVSLTEAKAHLRVMHSEDDTLIAAMVQAATDYLDAAHGIVGKALVTQTWRLSMDHGPSDAIMLTLPPVQSVTEIAYYDADGVEQVFDDANYRLTINTDAAWVDLVEGASWPVLSSDHREAIWVDFVTGYGDPDEVPQMIRHAALMLLAHWYRNRDAVSGSEMTEVPLAVDSIITAFRVPKAFF